jgi:hypothetical protein
MGGGKMIAPAMYDTRNMIVSSRNLPARKKADLAFMLNPEK